MISKVSRFTFKWIAIAATVFILCAGYSLAKSVWTWEKPCPYRSTPTVPYPCGEER